MIEKIKKAASYIQKVNIKADIALVLGSGLGEMVAEINEPEIIPYEEIPNFPVSTVEGHVGQLLIGKLQGKNIIVMQGRFHYYEGYNMAQVTMPVRVMKLLGVKKLIVTNAAGGVNRNFNPGELMLIADHINLLGTNPLIGKNLDELGPRFPDMSQAYNLKLIELGENVAKNKGIILRKGIYAAMTGPSFETPAEIRYLEKIGADAVGMSTVPEVIVANHIGMDVLGISCITNMAAGILPQPLSHEEVIETTAKVKDKFVDLLKGIVEKI